MIAKAVSQGADMVVLPECFNRYERWMRKDLGA